jgi:hypothetical protein
MVVVKEEDHKKALEMVHPFVKDVMDELMWNKRKLFGQNLVFLNEFFEDHHIGIPDELYEIAPEEYKDKNVDVYFIEYREELDKLKAEYLIESEYY